MPTCMGRCCTGTKAAGSLSPLCHAQWYNSSSVLGWDMELGELAMGEAHAELLPGHAAALPLTGAVGV